MRSLLLSALAASVVAVPTTPLKVVHEKRSYLGASQYTRSAPVQRDAVIPVRIGLAQSNLDKAEEYIFDVSHPSSPHYGKHWTSEEIQATFQPSAESVKQVQDWLRQSGIQNVKQTSNKGWVAFEASIDQVESMFSASYHEYTDAEGNIRLGCDQYSLPQHLIPHIDYVTPGVKLSPVMKKSKTKRDAFGWGGGHGRGGGWSGPGWGWPQPPHWKPHWGPWNPPPGSSQLPPDVQECGMNITPPCIRALYDIPFPNNRIADGIMGVAEFSPLDAYNQENLNQYFATYAPYVPQDTHPNLDSVNGAVAPVPIDSKENGGESDVDFDIVFSLLGDVPVTLYQVQAPASEPKNYTGNDIFNALLDAVDGSYCNDEDKADGFECGTTSLTSVLSVSYGGSEIGVPFKGQQRVCNEFMKLGLQGHTIVFSSGDYGVAGTPTSCDSNSCLPRSSQAQDASGPIFNPQFPASCPYVLAVGATQLNSDDTIRDPESVMYLPTEGKQQQSKCPNPTTYFTSGGGFSNMFKRPSYQDNAVSSYLANHNPGYASYELSGAQIDNVDSIPTGVYNRIGRAYPDVSANGAHFNIFVSNTTFQTAGTSLAAPIWSSMLAMINQKRSEIGKGPVGFVNQVLYENTRIFHDITKGKNPGCGTDGFPAVPGWDASTGLGTPVFPSMERLFLSLP